VGMGWWLSLVLVLAGCGANAAKTASAHDRAAVVAVLNAHGFAPPASTSAADGSLWIISSRPAGKRTPTALDRVVVRLCGCGTAPEVEIRRYLHGPTDWAVAGSLLGGEDVAEEARAISDELGRRLGTAGA